MKKYFLIVSLLVTIVAFSQSKETYNIGILLDNQTSETAPLLLSLQDEITAAVGEDAIINFSEANVLVNNYSIEKATANYNTLLNNNTDIIIAFGVINNEVISRLDNHVKPTILFVLVNNDFGHFDENKISSGITNFTYLVVHQSLKGDLLTLKELTNFDTVGVAIEQELVDVLPFKKLLDKEAATMGINYRIIPYKTADDITSQLNNTIDAFYLASGFYLNKTDIDTIAAKLISEKIPSFTSTAIDDVESGLMATNHPNDNITQFFRRVALSVEAYVNGEKLSEMPVLFQYDDKLTVNYNTIASLEIQVKHSLIAGTNFVGEIVNIGSDKKYNLMDVMETVVGENLRLKSSKKEIELSEQDVKTSKSDYYPSVTADAGGYYVDPKLAEGSLGLNPEFKTSGAISLDQTIYSEAATANISIQKDLLKAEQEVYNTDELDAIFEASSVYFYALILKANLQIQSQNLNLTKTNLKVAKQNYEAGQAGKSDVLRFTSEQAQNTQEVVEAINALKQTYFLLNQILNNPITLEIDVDEAELGVGVLEKYDYQQLITIIDDPKLMKDFVVYLVEVAKENSPEIKALDYNLKATKRSLKLSSSGRFIPTLALRGDYNSIFSRSGAGSTAPSGFSLPDNYYTVGVNASLPIFNRTRNNINKQLAIIQQDQLTIDKESIEQNITTNVNTAILDIINEMVNIEISKVSEAAAKESLELTQVSYANGAVNIIQLLDAKNNYLSSQQDQVTAVYNFLLNAIALERYIGYYYLLHTHEENQVFIQSFYDNLQN